MADQPEAEVYMITVTDDKGNDIVAYVKPAAKATYVRNMSSEYGVPTIVPMMMADLPADVEFRK
jgi:hypothetical protein